MRTLEHPPPSRRTTPEYVTTVVRGRDGNPPIELGRLQETTFGGYTIPTRVSVGWFVGSPEFENRANSSAPRLMMQRSGKPPRQVNYGPSYDPASLSPR